MDDESRPQDNFTTLRLFKDIDRESLVVIRNAAFSKSIEEAQHCKEEFLPISADQFMEVLSDPCIDPVKDIVIVEVNSSPAGYTILDSRRQDQKVLNIQSLFVHPNFWGRGLGTRLLETIMSRASKGSYTEIEMKWVRDYWSRGRALLEKHGFFIARYWWNLRLEKFLPAGETCTPPFLSFREFDGDKDVKLLTDLFNQCFLGEWGYVEQDVKELEYYTGLENFDPGDIIFAITKTPVQAVGFVIIKSAPPGRPPDGMGAINVLGVLPEWRRRKIGSSLLFYALEKVRRKGNTSVEIDVDSENPDALALYYKTGFEVFDRSMTYQYTF